MKTMKNLIWMAALALTAATWSACSNDDEPTAAEQSAQSRTYTVTTTLSPRNGAATRSKMTDVGGTTGITAEWEVGDQIWVGYYQVGGDYQNTTAVVTAVDPSTKAATIRVTLTNPNNDGNIYFGYPYSYYAKTKNPYTDQTGTLADINANFAAIEASGVMYVSSSGVTLSIGSIQPQMCIWKFSFTDGTTPITSDITSDITKLVINIPENNQTYIVTPSSLSDIYVAMYGSGFSTPKSISIYAKTATGVYRMSAASITLAAGKTYTSTGVALSSAAAANVVAGDLGKVIGADGNIYPNANIATTFGTTARAVIAYVGSVPKYFSHFIAIALEDVVPSTTYYYWADALGKVGDFAAAHPITIGSTTYNTSTTGSTYYDQVQGNKSVSSATATAAQTGWRLPSITDWRYIFEGFGGPKVSDQAGVDGGTEMSYGNGEALCNAINTACGNTALSQSNYWTSSEYKGNSEYVWYYGFWDGITDIQKKAQGQYQVRAVFAY